MTSTGTVGTVAATLLGACVAILLPLGMSTLDTSAPVHAQQLAPSPVLDCPPAPDLSAPLTEIVSDGKGRVRGTIVLADGRQAFPLGNTRCVQQLLRFYQTTEMPFNPTVAVPLPTPGPTVRARLGDVVQLLFLNQINVLDYGDTIDVWEEAKGDCDSTSTTPKYPDGAKDISPNCFHGSTSGNIHYHGTHTNPNGVGDNVFQVIRPSPWSKEGTPKPVITEAVARQNLGTFFDDCEKRLRADNLSTWPSVWSDLPSTYTSWQEQLLIENGKGKPEPQQLWLGSLDKIKRGQFPQFFIGAFPSCFVVPKYPGTLPTPGAKLRMGQAPGTHWYHAHKHGSTAINVSNGMSGAFIIEGDEYDGFFDKTYARFRQNTKTTWTRQQPTLVVNQYTATPNLERAPGKPGRPSPPPLAVNGSLQPTLTMYPGQVKLLRIVNSSTVSGFYISQLPAGFTWRQTAQDGVQFDNGNYVARAQRPVFVGPANRVDILVKAPLQTHVYPLTVSQSSSVSAAQSAPPSVVLFNISVTGTGPAMTLVAAMPPRPAFLNDISPKEVTGDANQTLTFKTAGQSSGQSRHTINDLQWSQAGATIEIPVVNSVGEWTVKNETAGTPAIDHPFHIHINPFQVTEVFDPRAPLLGKTGVPVRDAKGQVVPVYMVATTQPTLQAGQCWLNPNDKNTWKPCAAAVSPSAKTNIWWDVFPIPSGIRYPLDPDQGPQVTIPGYFKFRTRFVDYAGSYVFHCHILAHEDRGMMFQVNIGPAAKGIHMIH
jgi:FtsP/CotA-like multicopper oxidase with cupredoxin domain